MNDVWILRNDFFSLMIGFLEINAAVFFVHYIFRGIYSLVVSWWRRKYVSFGWNKCEGNYQKCCAKDMRSFGGIVLLENRPHNLNIHINTYIHAVWTTKKNNTLLYSLYRVVYLAATDDHVSCNSLFIRLMQQ